MLSVTKWPVVFLLKAFFRLEVDGDMNMPQTGLCEVREKDLIIHCSAQTAAKENLCSAFFIRKGTSLSLEGVLIDVWVLIRLSSSFG